MKTTMLKWMSAAAGLCLVISLTARAEDANKDNAAAKPGANREELEKFKEKLKDMTPEQRQEAIKKFREKMGQKGGRIPGGGDGAEMEKLREKMKDMTPEQRREALQKMGEKMKERIEQNDKLTAEQKKEILAHMEQMKTEREKIMNDPNLNEEQKRDALQKLREKARDQFQKHREAFEGRAPHKGPPAKGGDKPKAEPQQGVEAKPSV